MAVLLSQALLTQGFYAALRIAFKCAYHNTAINIHLIIVFSLLLVFYRFSTLLETDSANHKNEQNTRKISANQLRAKLKQMLPAKRAELPCTAFWVTVSLYLQGN